MTAVSLKSLTVMCFSVLYSSFACLAGEPILRISGRRKKTQLDLQQLRRVLIVQLDEIGDVVMTTPLLREARRNLPNSKISLLVTSTTFNLVECCPYVDEVLDFGQIRSGGVNAIKAPLKSLRAARRQLWKRQFDLAIVPRWDEDVHQAIFAAYFSGSTFRLGYSERVNERKALLNKGYDRLLSHPILDRSIQHEVDHDLGVLTLLDADIQSHDLELWTTSLDEQRAIEIVAEASTERSKIRVAFCPGAAAANRMWPIAGYLELGKRLQKEYGAHIFVIGGPSDTQLGKTICSSIGEGVTDLTGRTTLRETYALLKRCHLYIGSDTGPMHIAAAAQIPVIEISCHPKDGRTDSVNAPERVGPRTPVRVILQPESAMPQCSDECIGKMPHCITQITVKDVYFAVRSVLSSDL